MVVAAVPKAGAHEPHDLDEVKAIEWNWRRVASVAAAFGTIALVFSLSESSPQKHTFSLGVEHYSRPGLVSSRGGDLYCPLREPIRSEKKSRESVDYCDVIATFLGRELTDEQWQQIAGNQGDTGFMIRLPSLGNLDVRVMAPAYLHYRTAVRFLEQHYLSASEPFEQPASVIERDIRRVHHLLLKGKEDMLMYRNRHMIVSDEGPWRESIEGIAQALRNNGASEAEVWSALAILKTPDPDQALRKAPKIKRVLEKVFSFPLYAEEIPSAMTALALELKEKGPLLFQRKIDPIAFAAKIHQRIVGIHPFDDGNGRLARLWMNLILQLGRERSVIFSTEAEYYKAASHLSDPAALELLLRKETSTKG